MEGGAGGPWGGLVCTQVVGHLRCSWVFAEIRCVWDREVEQDGRLLAEYLEGGVALSRGGNRGETSWEED